MSLKGRKMETPIVIVFDGNVDSLLIHLLKQHAKNEEAKQVTWFPKRKKSKLETLRDELHVRNQMKEELENEYNRLRPEYLQVLEIKEACEVIQENVGNLMKENEKLEIEVEKMRTTISQKESYTKLNSALEKTMKPLLAKNKALKKEKDRVTKKYDKLNQEAFKNKERLREREAIIQENKDLLEVIRFTQRKTADLCTKNIVSHHISNFKEHQVRLIDELKTLYLNPKYVHDVDVELQMLQMEKRAYSDCNKALEKEREALMKKNLSQQQKEFKILQEGEQIGLLRNTFVALQEEVEIKGDIFKQCLTSEMSLHERSKIQKSVKYDVATQTANLTNLKMPRAGASTQPVLEEAGGRFGIVAEKFDVQIQDEEDFESTESLLFLPCEPGDFSWDSNSSDEY